MKVSGRAYALHNHYQANRSKLAASMQRLSTGDRMAVPGDAAPAAILSISERFRSKIHNAEAATQSVQTAITYLNTTNKFLDNGFALLQRMMEVAALAADGTKDDTDRSIAQDEFDALQFELSAMTRQANFLDRQTVGRDAMVSYDANSKHIQFFLPNGDVSHEIRRDFSSTGIDANGTSIGFDSSEDFTMSRDGRSLYFLGTVAGDAAGKVRVKRYDIESHMVYTGADLFDTGDKLFVDEEGSLYANGVGTLYTIDKSALGRTATTTTDLTTGSDFSVYKGSVNYYRTDNNVVRRVISTGSTTTLTGPIVFGAGDHTFAGAGNYIADEDAAGQIRVIDTRTGNSSSLAIGAANTVMNLKFNEDGNRIYFLNDVSNTIEYIDVSTDENDAVVLSGPTTAVQGVNTGSFNGLDLGGTNFGSITKFLLAEDDTSIMSYEAADIRLYGLGLVNTRVDTYSNASSAIDDIRTALNRLNAQRAQVGAYASRFERTLSAHRNYLSKMQEAESTIRDVDIAREATIMSTLQVRDSAAASVLNRFHQLNQSVLALLQT